MIADQQPRPQPVLANPFLRRIRHSGFLLPAALSGYLWLKGSHAGLPGWPCPVRALTGIPCPTCFLTRATAAALQGELAEAVQLHAFGPVVAAGLLWWSITAIRQRRLLPTGLTRSLRNRPIVVGAGGGLLGYWLLRLALQFGLGLAAFPSA